MRFGLHYLLSCADDQTPQRRYRDTIEQAVHAESLGFESVWPVEQHFFRNVSALPCPTLLLAAIAERTTRLRLGTGIVQLPLTHPLRVAEELATLDVISGGRAELGVGRGGNPAHYSGFGVSMAHNRERMEEGLRVIERAWREERFSFAGRFYQVEDLALAPRPVQSPRPPIRVAANSLDTAVWAGRAGYPVIFAANINPFAKLTPLIAAYRSARAEVGLPCEKDDISLLMPVYVGESREQVKRELEPSVLHYAGMAAQLAAAALPKCPSEAARRELQPIVERLQRMNFETLEDTFGIVGTAETCVERLRALEQQLQHGRVIAWFNFGGLVPHASVMHSMERFARDVLTHVA